MALRGPSCPFVDIFLSLPQVAGPTGVLEGVAGKTGAQLKGGQLGVGAGLEQCKRQVASWKLVVTSGTGVRRVTNGAGLAVQGRLLSVDGIAPARRMRYGSHDLMASGAISSTANGRRNMSVANETLGIPRRGFLPVVSSETRGVRQGLRATAVAGRQSTLLRVDVAELAVFHPEMGHQLLLPIVAGHAVQDLRVAEIGQALTPGDLVVAGDAGDIPRLTGSQMGQVGEFQVHWHPRGLVRPRQPTFLAEARVFPFSRSMTLLTIGARRRGGQMRLDVRLGMASGAFSVTRKPGENTLSFKLVTKGAVGAKPRSRIQPRLFVQVLGMREAEQERLRLVELRIRP